MYGRELRLLRSLELERVNLMQGVSIANELSCARGGVAKGRKSIWSAAVLAEARGSQRSLIRQQSSLRQLNTQRSTQRDLHAARDAAALLAAAKESEAKVEKLLHEETELRDSLPDVVQKLILGYELRTFYFELIECARKLLIVCIPVFFSPAGSPPQLIFGLLVCFLTFGAYMMYAPYVNDDDDRIAQICQVQIFFALLSSVMLRYSPDRLAGAANIDVLLSILTILPISLALYLETPLSEYLRPSKLAEHSKALRKLAGFSPSDLPSWRSTRRPSRPEEPAAGEEADARSQHLATVSEEAAVPSLDSTGLKATSLHGGATFGEAIQANTGGGIQADPDAGSSAQPPSAVVDEESGRLGTLLRAASRPFQMRLSRMVASGGDDEERSQLGI